MKRLTCSLTACTGVCAALALAGATLAQGPPTPFFSELLVNPPGVDPGLESIEITGPKGAALPGVFILIIEGDGTGAGVVDHLIPLANASLGANGVLLIRDSPLQLQPPPEPGTNVI